MAKTNLVKCNLICNNRNNKTRNNNIVCAYLLSCGQLFVTPWTVACQAPLSMRVPQQECWSGSPFPSPGNFPNPRFKPESPTLQTDSLQSEL